MPRDPENQDRYYVPRGLPTLNPRNPTLPGARIPTQGTGSMGSLYTPNYLAGRDLKANPWDVYPIPANAGTVSGYGGAPLGIPQTPSNNVLGSGNNPNEPYGMTRQYNDPRLNPQGGTGAKPKTWRDIGHEQVDSKLGAGWADNFSKAHGMSPLDFYTDKRNWFKYQADAAADYGIDSKEFANATIRATIEEGMKHQQEAAMWQEKHGNTPIPDEMWQNWFYINRGMSNGPVVW